MKETAIQTAICQYLDYKGYMFYRTNTVGMYDPKRGAYRSFPKYCRRGAPDIVLIDHRNNGKYVGLEVKNAKGRQSPEQERFEQDVKGVGAEYYVVRSIEDVERLGF